jgi:hypothetical protein
LLLPGCLLCLLYRHWALHLYLSYACAQTPYGPLDVLAGGAATSLPPA